MTLYNVYLTLLQAEVNCLGQIDHPNLVKLIGYCVDDDHKILVYEFMERGSLDSYLFRSHFTKSSNIYSFGVVLLELLTGQRCIHKNGPEGERILVEFAKPFLTKDLKGIDNIIDPHRDEHYSSGAVHGAALILKRCLYEDPTADEIVEELERLQLPLNSIV
ncbi:putative transferase, protein kinase RLK-Pelle-RLCK-VIIa-2 family [Helianthus annuus]|nr:putative transferase, protein kinase RLK-Pelle-RLCK-VIIa-2 family [Helianthus annuus]